jgi:hypothetical protein
MSSHKDGLARVFQTHSNDLGDRSRASPAQAGDCGPVCAGRLCEADIYTETARVQSIARPDPKRRPAGAVQYVTRLCLHDSTPNELAIQSASVVFVPARMVK